ncbi:MAG: hypothetical protein DI598_04830 [Pseudopedobacter saltans]|uniref:Adhesin domain-containing protein n=1 Tax=Pseudopedobacter saltans TaxID=151895 RepID=A0A2W5H5A0_9SPHI|nr:MAG: hypothetical protein DI598_04830 [Pseudopedobacter saltans]
MKLYNFFIVLSFFTIVIGNKSFAQKTHVTTTTTSTSNGATFTTTTTSNSETADTTKWKYREISKDFAIGNKTPIYIESVNRNLEIKTWDQPTVRIVAKAKYQNDSDANKSFDDVFETSGVKIRNTGQAFEILGTMHNSVIFQDVNMRGTPIGVGFDGKSRSAAFINPGVAASSSSFVGTANNIVITSPTFFHSDNGDTVMFNKDSLSTNLRVFLKDKGNANNTIVVRNKLKTNKLKIEELSKQLETLSVKLAKLSSEDATKNSKEIAKTNQEIAKISNQIAFQSAGNMINIIPDTSRVTVKGLKLDWAKPMGQSFGSGNSFSFEPKYKTDLKWTIYIPKNHKLSIDSKYGDITIADDIDSAKIISKYGNVDAKNVQSLVARNEYGNIYTGNVTEADIELKRGSLKMQNVENLKIDSKNANIDLDQVGNIKVESSNDNYDVSSIKSLDANKSYGTFRLTTLNGKMNFNGVNADIKIRNITPTTSSIDITNKFANISLPFADIKNYNIAVNGSFNTSFDDFDIVNKNDKGFNATKGNGKDLNASINCNNCQLDFK